MSDQENIESKIISAMRRACSDTFKFSEDETRPIDAEYLFTVNVAKEIETLNTGLGYPYKIYLEYPTKRFVSHCTPPIKGEITSNQAAFKQLLNGMRKGRIDVVVYREGVVCAIPVCAIELKGFDPQRRVVIEDLKRNAKYFDVPLESGASQNSFTVFAAMHSYKNVRDGNSMLINENLMRSQYAKWLAALGTPRNYKSKIEVFTFDSNLAKDQIVPPEEELSDFESHQFVGVMVTFIGAQ